MKRIILPVDFSKHSEYALKVGATLAKKHDAELIVMHMLELSESIFSSSSSDKQEETAFMLMVANKEFENFLDKDFLSDVKITPMIKHHKVLKEVDRVAKEIDADLIIMGSRGHSDHDGIFTGSNTEKVVRYSDTPVLVIKSDQDSVNFNDIVLATDFSEESISAVKKAIQLLGQLGSNCTLVHVNLPNTGFLSTSEIEEKRDEFLNRSGLKDWSEKIDYVSDYSVEDGVLNFAEKTGVNAIAITTHGRTGLSHFFGGSISEDLVNHSKLPVITFKY